MYVVILATFPGYVNDGTYLEFNNWIEVVFMPVFWVNFAFSNLVCYVSGIFTLFAIIKILNLAKKIT